MLMLIIGVVIGLISPVKVVISFRKKTVWFGALSEKGKP